MISLNTSEQVRASLIQQIFEDSGHNFTDTEIAIYQQILGRLTDPQFELFSSKYMLGQWGHFESQDKFASETCPLIYLKKYEFDTNFTDSFVIADLNTIFYQQNVNFANSYQLLDNIVPIDFDTMIEIMARELEKP